MLRSVAGCGIGCFVIAFFYNPWVALVVLGTFPLVAMAGALLQYVQTTSTEKITVCADWCSSCRRRAGFHRARRCPV